MRLLLDMGVSPRTGDFLRRHGHDAVHLRDENLQRLPDPLIVKKAAAEGRIVVTFDLGFSRVLALQRIAQPSVVLFRLQTFTTDQLGSRLLEVLTNRRAELEAGAIVVVDPDRTRTHLLPIL